MTIRRVIAACALTLAATMAFTGVAGAAEPAATLPGVPGVPGLPDVLTPEVICPRADALQGAIDKVQAMVDAQIAANANSPLLPLLQYAQGILAQVETQFQAFVAANCVGVDTSKVTGLPAFFTTAICARADKIQVKIDKLQAKLAAAIAKLEAKKPGSTALAKAQKALDLTNQGEAKFQAFVAANCTA